MGVGLVFGVGGEMLVNTGRPGVWMVYSNGTWLRRGKPRFPEDRPPLTEQTGPQQYRVTPAQHTAAGIATIGDSFVLQGIGSLPRAFDWNNPPRRDEFVSSLGLYLRNGEHLATFRLPPGVSTAFLTSDRETKRFFLPTTEPYPQAIEYALELCAQVR
jgi:hypothetical protein